MKVNIDILSGYLAHHNERKHMGMFDYVHFEMPCPNCGNLLDRFQTKDSYCRMDTIEPDDIDDFYSMCGKCNCWVEFTRPMSEPRALRDKPLTLHEVEEKGFTMTIKNSKK